MRARWLLSGSVTGLGLLSLVASQAARADQFHYNNVLVGTRAVGLGGAFAAVSDDASGMYYNPAGLAFALSNDVQGSANTFYSKKTTYKNTIGGKPFEEDSSGSLTPFFGGLQKLDRYVEGLTAAFGVYYVDGDLKDQDTKIQGLPVNDLTITRYHRTSNARDSTYYAGAALGYRVTANFALGFGLNYFNADELVQEYQDADQTVKDTAGNTLYKVLGANVREHLAVYGIQPVLGAQLALPGGFSLGLTVKKGLIASQSYEATSENRDALLSPAEHDKLSTGAVGTDQALLVEEESKDAVGDWPMEVRAGMAWFASPTLLWTLDAIYTGAAKGGAKLATNGGQAKYEREAVTNFGTGLEWYTTPSIPLRFGLFTNNDARPKIDKSKFGQPDHIDYLGESLFIAWVQPSSQVAAGITLQQGKGQAQKLGDYHVQDVEASSYSFGFSATHNL